MDVEDQVSMDSAVEYTKRKHGVSHLLQGGTHDCVSEDLTTLGTSLLIGCEAGGGRMWCACGWS